MITTFITVLAVLGAIIGTLLTIAGIISEKNYHHGGVDGGDSLEKLLDAMRGVEKKWHYGSYMLTALISYAWIAAVLWNSFYVVN